MSRDLNVRDAGDLINRSGLGRDDAPRMRDENAPRGRAARDRNQSEPDDRDDDPREDDEDDDDAGTSGSRRDRESDPDESDDEDGDENEGDDGEDDDHQGDEGDDHDEDESPADPLDALHEVKVNGKIEKLPLREIIKGYQRDSDYRAKTTQLATRRRALDEGHAKVATQYQRKLQITAGVVNTVKQMLVGDINSAAMQQLRATDPGEWAVQRQVMQDRIDNVGRILGQVQQEHERHASEKEQNDARTRQEAIPHEMEMISREIPDWQDGGARRLGKYLSRSGFTPDEIQGVYDHRMLLVADKARKWDELQAAKTSAKGKRKTKQAAPKRPTGQQNGSSRLQRQPAGQQTRKRKGFRDARARARKTGDMRDAGKAISYLLD